MWNVFFIGVVAVLAGACVTWLIGDGLSESIAARSEDAGRFAGLGSAPREVVKRRARVGAVAAARRRAGAATRRRIAHPMQRSPIQSKP
ncbi:MAG TPA: hypothetical protein VL689_18355 [Paraburkholderia sp.]|nr:hypothetical protein [Paraburkholderia sp.]